MPQRKLFQRRHFDALAACIKTNDCFDGSRMDLVQKFGEMLEAYSDGFDWSRWFNATLTLQEALDAGLIARTNGRAAEELE